MVYLHLKFNEKEGGGTQGKQRQAGDEYGKEDFQQG
jgi:hypothetical protein